MYKLHGKITREFFGLRMRNFQGIVSIWTQPYREIFTSTLVYFFKKHWHWAEKSIAYKKACISMDGMVIKERSVENDIFNKNLQLEIFNVD